MFAQGSEANELFIVKTGKLLLEVVIEVIDCNIYPTGKNLWEKLITMKKYVYRVRELNPGDFFGHEELVIPFDNPEGSMIYKYRHC